MTDTTYEGFEVSTDDDGIAHIVLNNPDKRNAMTRGFWDDLPAALRALDQLGTVKIIVLSSTGPHFTAGIDLASFAQVTAELGAGDNDTHRAATLPLAFYENVRVMQDAFSALEKVRMPVLVAIQGGCIGGGVDLVTACDMRYCTEDAFFTIYEINIGMTADVGTFPRILNHLPEGVVRELAYTGRKMHAAEAMSLGLINTVYPDEKSMLDGVMALAREIATKPQIAVYGCKNIITYSRDHTTTESLDYIGLWNASMLQQSEIMEAMAAKQMKRDGNFAPLPAIKKVSE